MKVAAAKTGAGSNAEATARGTAVEVRAEGSVGTICLRGPCALCDRDFEVENGQARLAAHDRARNRLGLVCLRCASSSAEALKERLLSRARRLRLKASRLERLVEGGIGIHQTARDAASAVRAGAKESL